MIRISSRSLGLALILSTATLHGAAAQMAVLDAPNLIQSTLSAGRQLQQIANQVRELQNEAQQIQYMAQQVQSLDVSRLNELQSSYYRLQGLLTQTQSIGNYARSQAAKFQQLYPTTSAVPDFITADARQTAAMSDIKASLQNSYDTQYTVTDAIAARNRTTSDLLSASDAAPGEKAAVQATNQLLGQVTSQVNDLNASIAAQSQVMANVAAQNANDRQQASDAHDQFWKMDPAPPGQSYNPYTHIK
jgi:P-type conjugative transfer protein TrbJ